MEKLNLPSIIVLSILVITLICVIIYLIKNRKNGCIGCFNSGCPYRNKKKGCKDKISIK